MSTRTVGVEEEFLVVDATGGEPRAVAGAVVARAAAALARPAGAGESAAKGETLQTELQRQQLEIASSPCSRLGDLAADLCERRAGAARWAAREGAAIVALATSPLKGAPRTTAGDRYARMAERFALTAREQLTCGCHVHVEVAGPEEGVAALDRIRPWLPVLRALSANSPFWQEQDTGFASYRSELWGRWPSAGPTSIFGSVGVYRDTVAALLATDTILDVGMVYFDARLSDTYPTLEVRVADVCLDVADAVLLAAVVRALVHTAVAAWKAGEPPDPVRTEALRLAHWRAARSGLDGVLVDPRTGRPAPAAAVTDALLRHIAPGLAATGDATTVRKLLAGLHERGTGARWQRQIHDRTGDWTAVTRQAVSRTAQTPAI